MTPHRTAPGVILAVVAAQVALSLLINLVVFPSGALTGIASATSGLVQPTLSANVVMFVINVVVIMGVWGGLRAADLGLRPTRGMLMWSIAGAIGAWLIGQAWLVGQGRTAGVEVGLFRGWRDGAAFATVGRFLAQVFGNALYEETVFRGFLLVQLAWWWHARRSSGSVVDPAVPDRTTTGPGVGTWSLALLVSQMIFALAHIPNRIMKGDYPDVDAVIRDQSMLLVAGLGYGIIYLGTRSLVLCILLHALMNQPMPLLEVSGATARQAARGGADGVAAATAVTLLASIAILAARGWRRRRL